MADLLGTAKYLVWCRGHGLVGRYASIDDANTGASDHWTAVHQGFGRDQTIADAVVAQDAEVFIAQCNVTTPADLSSSSSSSA